MRLKRKIKTATAPYTKQWSEMAKVFHKVNIAAEEKLGKGAVLHSFFSFQKKLLIITSLRLLFGGVTMETLNGFTNLFPKGRHGLIYFLWKIMKLARPR